MTLALKGVSDAGRSPTKPAKLAPKARKASARAAMTPQEALVNALNDRGKESGCDNGLLRIACFTTKSRGHAWTLISPRTGNRYLDNDTMRARLEAAGFEEDPDRAGWAGRYVLYASDVQAPEGKSEQFKATVAALGLPSDPWAAPFAAFDEAGWFLHPDCNTEAWLPPLDSMEVPDTSSPLSRVTPLTPPTPINSQEAAEPPTNLAGHMVTLDYMGGGEITARVVRDDGGETLLVEYNDEPFEYKRSDLTGWFVSPVPEMQEPLPPAHAAALAKLNVALYGPDAPKRPRSLAECIEMAKPLLDAAGFDRCMAAADKAAAGAGASA